MIELKDVSKSYRSGGKKQQVLSHASLTLPDTGLIFIVGQSGSGKSTALNTIGGLLDYEGSILYDGEAVNMETYRRKNVAYIFQDFLLFDDLSVRENIKIALEIAGIHDEKEISKRVGLLLKAVNLAINPSRKAGALSLGQRQRVAIARALALSPKLILADEPTGNLDTKNSKTILSLLKSLAKDRLVLIVSHNLNLVRLYADAAYAIQEGKFVSLDPQSIALDSSYGDTAIELAEMEQEEIDSPSLMVKLFVAKGEKKQKISIIQKNGKLILVADNGQAMKTNEISIIDASGSFEEEGGEKVNEELLNFQAVEEDKQASRKSKWSRIKETALSSHGAGKRKVIGHLYRFFEVLAPLAIFLAVDAMAIAFQEVDKTLGYQESYADSISFIGEARQVDEVDEIYQNRSFDFEDAYHWVKDDNGISSFYPGYGNHEYGPLQFEVNSLLPVSYGAEGTPKVTAKKFDFVSIDDYKDVASFSALKKYNLADDEIVLPIQLLGDLVECPCFGGKPLVEAIVGTRIRMSRPVLTETEETPAMFSLKIVGVEDLPIDHVPVIDTEMKAVRYSFVTPFFVSAKKAVEMKTYSAAAYAHPYYAQNMLLPKKFEGYTFYEFGETARKESFPGGSPMWTLNDGYHFEEHVLDTYSEDSLSAAVAYGLPIFFMSEAAYEDLPTDLVSHNRFFGEKVGRYAIVKESDPDEKAIYFILPSYFSATAVYSSRDRFFGALAANAVTFNHVTEKPAGATADATFDREGHFIDVVVPSAYEEVMGGFDVYPAMEEGLEVWQRHAETGAFAYGSIISSIGERDLIPNLLRVVGTYPSDSFYDPVYIDPLAEFYLQGNVDEFEINTGAEEGVNPELVAYTDPLLLFSSDPAKTKRYFEEKLESFGVSAHTKRDLYYSTVRSDYVYLYFDYLFPVGALLLVVLVLVMLNASAKVNANKAGYGVLRCLGKKRGEILAEDSVAMLLHSIFFTAGPLALLTLVLILFDLYLLGWLVVPFFFAYTFLVLLFSELPLILTLRKPPIEIMHSLQ
ncbi:MAG: ABC transporter ATP-binding protein [Bacilli bacterium]|nr:ABC transporter ATP-binding protein [Bacilli bacterium]